MHQRSQQRSETRSKRNGYRMCAAYGVSCWQCGARAALLQRTRRRDKMCTLTFIPKPQGYLLGMNRDERLARETALAPEIVNLAGLEIIYPRENDGGTWIGSNSAGITFALLNQNSGPNTPGKERSRG